jgi:hypothetical protein
LKWAHNGLAVMNTALLREHLKQSERHVIAGAFRIARQRELVSELDHQRFKDVAASGGRLLVLFEELQAIHVANLRRLRTMLIEP